MSDFSDARRWPWKVARHIDASPARIDTLCLGGPRLLNLSASQSALDTFHQRFLDESLPPELSREAFARFDPTAYSAEELRVGLETWQLRALDEYRSQVAFTELLLQLTQLGFAFDAIGTCVRVVRDEARHVELCRRMVQVLGGDGIIPHEPNWVLSDASMPPMRQVLHTVVGSLCMGETFSVRLIAGSADQTTDPLARAVNRCLAADESIHSRFGWTLLELLAPSLTPEDHADIQALLPATFGACEQLVGVTVATADPVFANPFGAMTDASRREVFFNTLEKDVIRRFEALGIPAREAWEHRIVPTS